MSVMSYFPKAPDLRMPKLPDGKDELGICWKGRVVQGDLGVREALIRQAAGLSIERDAIRSQPSKADG